MSSAKRACEDPNRSFISEARNEPRACAASSGSVIIDDGPKACCAIFVHYRSQVNSAAQQGTAPSASSRRAPGRPDRSGHAVERTLDKLAHEQPRRIDRARHGGAALGDRLETGFAVVRLVAHQHDQSVTLCLRLSERPLDQGITDAALAKRRLDRERSEQ